MQYYQETPISELPEKDDIYYVICHNGTKRISSYKDGKFDWQGLPRITHWLKPIELSSIIEEEIKEAWIKGCCQTLKDISDTFLNEDNLRKSDRLSDRDIFQAVGETIRNFPIPNPPKQ